MFILIFHTCLLVLFGSCYVWKDGKDGAEIAWFVSYQLVCQII
jgi:hypothetical protein